MEEPSPHQRSRIALIADHPLFSGIDPMLITKLTAPLELRTLAPNDILLEPCTANKNLYLILSGELSALIDNPPYNESFPIPAGTIAGELSVADLKPPSAKVIASQPSQILVIPGNILWRELFKIPAISRNFMGLVSARVRDNMRRLREGLMQRHQLQSLNKELAIAHDLQLGMLPHNLEIGEEIRLAASMTPALQVGGDFYDAFPVGDKRYCVAIGDVSGKGIPAALFMVKTMSLLRTELLKEAPPGDSLTQLNRLLCDNNPTCMFCTLLVGILDGNDGTFHYACAGHDPIILIRHGQPPRVLEPPSGILVGVSEQAEYAVSKVDLQPGDRLVMYTDGITEAMDADLRPYELHRLIACLDQDHRSLEAMENSLRRSIETFVGQASASDDITWMIMEFQPPDQGA